MEILWVLGAVFIYWLAMSVGESMGERFIKRKILWHVYDYRDKTVKEMFDAILELTDDDWTRVEKRRQNEKHSN